MQNRIVNQKKPRLIQYDVVRAVAMLFVIAVHSLVVVDTSIGLGSYYEIAGQALFFTANFLFFVISGKFNLSERNASNPGVFYLKKFRGILIPVLILFLIRTLYDLSPDFLSVGHVLKTYTVNILGRYNEIEYWFIFQLVSMLVVVPFLVPMISAMKKSQSLQKLFFGMGIAWAVVWYAANNLDITFSWTYLFGGFLFAFCIGPFIEDLFSSKKSKIVIWVLAGVSIPLSIFLVSRGYAYGAFDRSPLYIVSAVGLYLALLTLGGKLQNEGVKTVVSFVANHSFSVYLIHMMVLRSLLAFIPAFPAEMSFVSHLLLTVVVFLVSLVFATIIDELVVRPVQKVFDKAVIFAKAFQAK